MVKNRRLSEQVIECAQNVSRELGAGFLEKVYENALCIELKRAGIHFQRQQCYGIRYRNEEIGNYIADLVVEEKLLVELKALSAFTGDHESQVMNYLKASGLNVGLLLNFGVSRLGIRRIVWNYDDKEQI
jgi:GxxExxY protein